MRWVQVKLQQWTWPLRTWVVTTVGGLMRGWRRVAQRDGRGGLADGRELRRVAEPHRRLREDRRLYEEGIVDRDTLVAVQGGRSEVRDAGPVDGAEPEVTGARASDDEGEEVPPTTSSRCRRAVGGPGGLPGPAIE